MSKIILYIINYTIKNFICQVKYLPIHLLGMSYARIELATDGLKARYSTN